MSLSAGASTQAFAAETSPPEALAHDEALLDAARSPGQMLSRWYVVHSPAVVLGLGLWQRRSEIVDEQRCREAGVPIVERRAGGGALLLDPNMLCGTVCIALPNARVGADLTESYRWLGDRLATALHGLGVSGARRVEVAEARANTAALKARADPLLNTCYGGLSPHEIVTHDGRKLVGLAQVRRRHAALFQFGVLLRDQSPLADLLRAPDSAARAELRAALADRTVGLYDLVSPAPDVASAASALERQLRA